MENFILNIDRDWSFPEQVRRYLLHWHPVVRPESFLITRQDNHATDEMDALPWPCIADSKKLTNILINCLAAGEYEQLKVAALISSSDPSAEDMAQFFKGVPRSGTTRYCLFLCQSQIDIDDTATRLESRVAPESAPDTFDLVFLTPDSDVDRLRTIMLCCDLLSKGIMFHDDFFRDAAQHDRILQASIEDTNQTIAVRYENAYHKTMAQLNKWITQTTGPLNAHESVTKDDLLTETMEFQKSLDKQSLQIEQDLIVAKPDPGLTPPAFFFDPGYYEGLKAQLNAFDRQLDTYLQKWFEIFNNKNRSYRENFDDEQKQRVDRLEHALQTLDRVETGVLEDAISTIEQGIEQHRSAIDVLLAAIQSGHTNETKESVQWDNRQNQGFVRKFFQKEEQAITAALNIIPTTWKLQPRKKIFWAALSFVTIMAAIPVVVLRDYRPGPDYWHNYNAWSLDTPWLGFYLIAASIGLYISGKKQQKRLHHAVGILSKKLGQLFQRHLKACEAAEKYAIRRLYQQDLGRVKDSLQEALARKRTEKLKLSGLEEFVRAQRQPVPYAIQDTVARNHSELNRPDRIDDWVVQAIKECFQVEDMEITLDNSLAPNTGTVHGSPYLAGKLHISRYIRRSRPRRTS